MRLCVPPDALLRRQSHDTVAVKIVPGHESKTPEDAALFFQQEIAIMHVLAFSPNIVPLLGYCNEPRAVVMPLYDGDLYDYLQQQGAFGIRPAPWTTLAAADIAAQLAGALADVHRIGVVHRDVKPKNVLLERLQYDPGSSASGFPYRARLCDFGISRVVAQENQIKSFVHVNVRGLSIKYVCRPPCGSRDSQN
jgi:serine/threonine protein kinase